MFHPGENFNPQPAKLPILVDTAPSSAVFDVVRSVFALNLVRESTRLVI